MKSIVLKASLVCLFLIWIFCNMNCRNVRASNEDQWEKEWEDLRKQMERESRSVLKKEITFGNEDMSEEEKSTSLKLYDIDNAIPMCTLSSDVTMLADFHKNDDDFSKLIQWNNRWYIPATTMTDGYASILLQKEKDGYQVYAQYFGDDEVYIADTEKEIKDKIKKEFQDTEIKQVQNISVPFYNLNLVYIKESDGEEKVIPYQAFGAATLDDINEKSGSVYSVSRFISDMESAYEEYTEKELAQIKEENETDGGGIGGALLPKKKMQSEAKKEDGDSAINYTIIVICSLFAIFVVMIFIVIQKKRGKNHA